MNNLISKIRYSSQIKIKTANYLFILLLSLPTTGINSSILSTMIYSENDNIWIFADMSNNEINRGVNAFTSEISTSFSFEPSLKNLLSHSGKLVIFAHGDEFGVTFNNEYFNWKDFAQLISRSKASEIILASCYGSNIFLDGYTGPQLITWNGKFDSILIGLSAAIYISYNQNKNDINTLSNIGSKLFLRALDLVTGTEEPLYLANSESTYQSAFKRKNSGPWYNKKRTFKLNFDYDTGYAWFEYPEEWGKHLAIETGLGNTRSGYIAAILVVDMAFAWYSEYNRKKRDFMFDITAYQVAPTIKLTIPVGDDPDFRSEYSPWQWIPNIPWVLYDAFGQISTNWVNAPKLNPENWASIPQPPYCGPPMCPGPV